MSIKHGFTRVGNVHRLHNIWRGVRKRCLSEASKSFIMYGGRGIRICKEWGEFINFYDWAMNNGYTDNLTLDRINNNGDYEPNNCHWVGMQAQARNRRTSRNIEYNNEIKTLAEWADFTGIAYTTLFARIKAGIPLDMAFQKNLPSKAKIKVTPTIKKVKGYSFDKSIGKYRAESWRGGKKKYIGVFLKEEDAANAYKHYITHFELVAEK